MLFISVILFDLLKRLFSVSLILVYTQLGFPGSEAMLAIIDIFKDILLSIDWAALWQSLFVHIKTLVETILNEVLTSEVTAQAVDTCMEHGEDCFSEEY